MKVLITVKAYPAISTKYGETVCTAGITEEGKWIRIYPIPYRMLDYSKQFRKYDWIEIDLIRNHKDPRPESYRPVDYSRITTISHIKADGGPWYNRRKIVLKKVYHNLQQLIEEAKGPEITSLAIYKPKKILNFIYEPIDKDWTPAQLDSLKSLKAQSSLFENQNDDEKDISRDCKLNSVQNEKSINL